MAAQAGRRQTGGAILIAFSPAPAISPGSAPHRAARPSGGDFQGEIATGWRCRQSVTAITSATSALIAGALVGDPHHQQDRPPAPPGAWPAAEARIGVEARGIPGCNAIPRPEVMALDGRGRGSGANQTGGL